MREDYIFKNQNDGGTSHLRPRILCIVDGPNWVFSRHVENFQHYLGDEFEILTAFRGQPYEESLYDLIYPLEFNMVDPDRIRDPGKYITGIRSFVAWADWDFLTLVNFLVTHFRSIHVVSRQLFNLFYPYIPDVRYVTHGVDLNYFYPTGSPSLDAGRLRLGWAGNRRTYVKGFRDFIEPLGSIPGVELIYCGFADRNLNYEEMPGFYDSIDAYVSASSFEGNNNTLLEAAAMARAIITTPTGTVPEYLRNNQNALIVERDVEQFKSAVLRLRDNPDLRVWLGQQARKSLIEAGWDWSIKAEDYRQFFKDGLDQSPVTAVDRVTIEPSDLRHYNQVLHTQFVLERELRIGYASKGIDLEQRIKGLEVEISAVRAELVTTQQEVQDIKASETYHLVEWLKSMKIARLFIWIKNLSRSFHKQDSST